MTRSSDRALLHFGISVTNSRLIQRIIAGKKANQLSDASPLGNAGGEVNSSRIAPVLHLLVRHGSIRTHRLARQALHLKKIVTIFYNVLIPLVLISLRSICPLLLNLCNRSRRLKLFLTILTRYRAKKTINAQAFHVPDGLRDAVCEQAKIGWHNFILGRLSKRHITIELAVGKRQGNGLRQSSINFP